MSRFLIAAFCLFAATLAHAQVVGRVLLAAGEVHAVRDGKLVPLRLGTEIEKGDRIRTGALSNAQVRFTDSGMVALRPESELSIEDYLFTGRQDGADRSSMNLVKGGLRAVTGLIGRLHQRNYAVKTPTSTIGIRGTNFTLVSCDAGCTNADGSKTTGTYGGVSDGRIAVTPNNNVEERSFGAGEFFHVPDANTPASQLIGPPPFLADRLEAQQRAGARSGSEGTSTAQNAIQIDPRAQTPEPPPPVLPFVATEQKAASGATAVLPLKPTGFIATYLYGSSVYEVVNDCGGGGGCHAGQANSFLFSGNSLTDYSSTAGYPKGSLGAGTVVDAGTASIGGAVYGWGRWTGAFQVLAANGVTYTNLPSGLMFGYTNDPAVGSGTGTRLPGSGVVSYQLVGGPRPVDTAGNIGSIDSMSGTVDFTSRLVNFGFHMTMPVAATSSNATFSMSGSGSIPPGHDSLIAATLSGSCVGAGCQAEPPTGQFDARFAGTAAQAMVVNGRVSGTSPADQVQFLNLLKCSGC
jgi:hypothetical protein